MSGDLLNIQFGTYSSTLSELKRNYDVKQQKTENGSEFTVYDKNTKRIVGNGYKEKIQLSEYSQPKFADAVIFKDDYMYGTCSKTKDGLEKFDYIVAKDKYAIDLNGNGKVDLNEIFSGNFDRFAYQKAKDVGDLNKYAQFLKEYNYNWLKK